MFSLANFRPKPHKGRPAKYLIQSFNYSTNLMLEKAKCRKVKILIPEAKAKGFKISKYNLDQGYLDLYLAPNRQTWVSFYFLENARLARGINIEVSEVNKYDVYEQNN